MKRFLSPILFALVTVTGHAQKQTESPERIQNFILDPTKEIEVPVSKRHATVIHFPKIVQGVIGYGLTDGKTPGTFQFSNPQGSNVVTVRNVMDDKDCYMTCVMGNHPYIFHLVPSDKPAITVKLQSPDALKEKVFGPVPATQASIKRLGYSSTGLIQAIRKARSRTVWELTYPDWYENAKRREVEMMTESGGVKAMISEIHQFPADDTLVFLGTISNSTAEALWLQPQAISMRVGERIYSAQMVDFTGEIGGNETAGFALVLKGNSTAGREHLAIENEFRLVLPQPQDPSFLAQAVTDLSDFENHEPTILPQK